MKILVTGASGYIGEEVALALRRRGHQVYGLVRSQEKGRRLIENEVIPVVGDIFNHDSYIHIAAQCEVIIHSANQYEDYSGFVGAAISGYKKRNPDSPRLLLIFTSGILDYAHNPNASVDETGATDSTSVLMKTRNEVGKKILFDEEYDAVVVRPAFVFGKKSQHFYEYFDQAEAGKVVLAGRPDIIWSQVHVDDLADAYIRIVEAPRSVVNRQYFHFSDDSRFTLGQIAKKFAETAGYTGEIPHDESKVPDFFLKTVIVESSKARRLLGWVPAHKLSLDEIELYYAYHKATKAAQEHKQ